MKHYHHFRQKGLLPRKRRANGTGTLNYGYIIHNKNGIDKAEHISIVEKVLGKKLPKGAEVHHWDGNRSNNIPQNLLVCPDRAYHMLMHQRMRALECCGNANYRKCVRCKEYDNISNMKYFDKHSFYHPECQAIYDRNRRI